MQKGMCLPYFKGEKVQILKRSCVNIIVVNHSKRVLEIRIGAHYMVAGPDLIMMVSCINRFYYVNLLMSRAPTILSVSVVVVVVIVSITVFHY